LEVIVLAKFVAIRISKYASDASELVLRTDDTNKKIDAWIDIYFLTYFHCKLYK
jgi:hypothetical protein